jgi:hypothetical protein
MCSQTPTAALSDVHVAKDHLDRHRHRHREADEGTEGDQIERGHRPGVLVFEDGELLLDVGFHFANGERAS